MDGSGNGTANEELLRELNDLRRRVEVIEATLKPPLASLEARDSSDLTSSAESVVPLLLDAASATEHEGKLKLESRIGAQVFNRIGIFAVLAGTAWFLKLAVDRAWIGPGVRTGIGLLVAGLLVLWSEHFRRAGSAAFSNTLKALAAGIAYLSLWACLNLYHLLPASVVFCAMLAVTVGNALLAWRQNSELLAALALAGGVATPELLSTGVDQELVLFSYLLLLDFGALALIALRPWPRLTIGAFAGTTAYFFLWWTRYYVPADEALTGGFIASFFVMFTVAPFLMLRDRSAGSGAQSNTMISVFPVMVGGCAFLEVYRLLSPGRPSPATSWVALILGLLYLGLAGLVDTAPPPIQRAARSLGGVHLALAVGFITLAAGLRYQGFGIALCWLAELFILAAAALRLRSHLLARPVRANAVAVLLLSFCSLLLLEGYDPQPSGQSAFFNAHFATYLAGLAVFAGVVVLSRTLSSSSPHPRSASSVFRMDDPAALAAFGVVGFNLIALTAVALQIDLYWHQQLILGKMGGRELHLPVYVDFTYSAWFMLYAGAIMLSGFFRRSAFLRWQALLLFTLSIGKVFLFDTSRLNEGYRVASFLGLGILLLAVSLAYQKDWLQLKGRVSP